MIVPPTPSSPHQMDKVELDGVLGSRVSCSALSTATIGKHKVGINRGVAPPR
jgi:hypothetical protein